jgi:phosphoglycerate dehydrogenase-like enzyme
MSFPLAALRDACGAQSRKRRTLLLLYTARALRRFIRMKVLITPMTLAGLDSPYLGVLREAGFEIVYPKRAFQLTEQELLEVLPGVCATIAGSEPYTPRVFAANPQLRTIARSGVGYDAINVAAATAHGVAVAIAPGTNHDAVAEHTFALMLALAKDVPNQHNALRAGEWPRKINLPLRGRTLGLAGLGRIGKAVAERGRAFGMRVLAYEPYPDQAFVARQGIKLVPFDTLLAESDYLSLHLPMSDTARHLINRRSLARMKPTAFLINTARGGLVCEADLVEALKSGRLAGAGLDVFEEEPTTRTHPLCQLSNVVLTPHAAGGDVESRDAMAMSAARTIVALRRGEWPAEAIVNPEVRQNFRW